MRIISDSIVRTRVLRICALAASACLALALLAACGPAEPEKDPAQLNREYMSSVNRIGNEASEALADFGEAAGKSDVAAMRVAAADAAKKLSKISELEAPEALADIHSEYQSGAEDVSAALSAYIDIFARMQSLDMADPSAKASVESSLKDVNAQYESGIKHLSLADEKVAELAGEGAQDGKAAEDGADAAKGEKQPADKQ